MKSQVFLPVKESPASLLVEWQNWYCMTALVVHITFWVPVL